MAEALKHNGPEDALIPRSALTGNEDDRILRLTTKVKRVESGLRVNPFWLAIRSHWYLITFLDVFIMLLWRPFALSGLVAVASVHLTPVIGVKYAAMLFTVATMLFVLPVITAWHRMIMVGADNPRAKVFYRLGRAEWSYFRAAILLYGLGYVLSLVVRELYGPLFGGPIWWLVDNGLDPFDILLVHGKRLVTVLAITSVLGVIIARFFMVLPAAAVGKKLSVSDSADATRGNGFRLVLAYVLATLPSAMLLLLFWSPMEILGADLDSEVKYLALLLAIVPHILLYTVSVGVLSLAYGKLIGVPRRLLV